MPCAYCRASAFDAHEESLGHVHVALDAVAARLEDIVRIQAQFAIDQAKTDAMLRDLISTTAREHTNGKGK